VAKRTRCGEIFNDYFITHYTAESDGERILKMGQPGLFKGQFTNCTSVGRTRRRRRRGGEVWGGGVPSQPGEGAVPPPRKKIDFVSQYGEFWCILDGIFFTVQLPVLHAKLV